MQSCRLQIKNKRKHKAREGREEVWCVCATCGTVVHTEMGATDGAARTHTDTPLSLSLALAEHGCRVVLSAWGWVMVMAIDKMVRGEAAQRAPHTMLCEAGQAMGV